MKTDARREAILDIATELFREVGYERASMAAISARAGGSKATLYNYFKSKEELFAAAMMEAMEDQGQALLDLLDASDNDVAAVLRRFGEAFLRLVTTPESLAIARTATAEAANSSLGARLYERGPKRAWDEVALYIRRLQERGKIRPGDPHLIAGHFRGMVEAGFVEPLLWGAPTEQEPATTTSAAVEAFLRAYASAE
ncbi:TetR/AcrR family transcriptional regulator [Novosphingobium sp.]|uniref:TetR/AcrR family transcriptional regulator n=1 Tax=Novosphingobium sp. TaxID=1874826 RepID=UPI002B49E396|nr:TetR/AcrR family transcriptional regulator [Novosphingobium sp.]HKR92479.1 TetR/AcrR family transcriptional regulator [Novosphingobium sp.]